jgi:hypothetical protein
MTGTVWTMHRGLVDDSARKRPVYLVPSLQAWELTRGGQDIYIMHKLDARFEVIDVERRQMMRVLENVGQVLLCCVYLVWFSEREGIAECIISPERRNGRHCLYRYYICLAPL